MVKLDLSVYVCVLILFHLSFYYGDIVEIPPLNITQQDFLKLLSLGDVEINIPALYVFGDSFVDNGNNKAVMGNDLVGGSYFPFGIDFDGKATGRVTNGRLAVDFIATAAGLPFPPPVMSMSEIDRKTIRTGVNYGSGSAGLLLENGHFLGKHVINFYQQVDLFESSTMAALKCSFDIPESFTDYLSKSVFYINVGSNDLGITYDFDMHNMYPDVEEYVKLLIQEISKQLRRLYVLGARKFLVSNVPPLGCQPFSLHVRKHTGPCVEQINQRISVYNDNLSGLLRHLQYTLPGSKFVLGDIYKVFREVIASPALYGFTDVSTSCCFDKNGTKFQVCAPYIAPCEDRNTRMFFDPFHPSEAMYFVWARRFLKDYSICTPITLIQLMQE